MCVTQPTAATAKTSLWWRPPPSRPSPRAARQTPKWRRRPNVTDGRRLQAISITSRPTPTTASTETTMQGLLACTSGASRCVSTRRSTQRLVSIAFRYGLNRFCSTEAEKKKVEPVNLKRTFSLSTSADLEKMNSLERISFLQEKLQDIRNHYLSLKSEVASIDRRRKRMKKKERESESSVTATVFSPQSGVWAAQVDLTTTEYFTI